MQVEHSLGHFVQEKEPSLLAQNVPGSHLAVWFEHSSMSTQEVTPSVSLISYPSAHLTHDAALSSVHPPEHAGLQGVHTELSVSDWKWVKGLH